MKSIITATLFCFVLLAGCKQDPEQAANKLFVETVPLWNQYKALPEGEPAQYQVRLDLLTQVVKNMDMIVSDYAESSLAVELVSTGQLKQLDTTEIAADVSMLEQSIPASALMGKLLPLWEQYQALPAEDPAQYAARSALLVAIQKDGHQLLKDFPLSYEVESLGDEVRNALAVAESTAPRLEQSIPASALMGKLLPLWEQYQALPDEDPAQYAARLALLIAIQRDGHQLLKDFPLSYEAEDLGGELEIALIVANEIIPRLEQSIPASALMGKLLPLWEQYQALPDEDPAQYAARLALLIAIQRDGQQLLKDFPLSYEAEDLGEVLSVAEEGIPRLEQNVQCENSKAACIISIALEVSERITNASDHAKLLSAIAKAQVASGDVSGAFKTAKGISDDADHAELLFAIAKAQAASGDVSGALKTAKGITDDADHAELLSAIAEAQVASGDVSGAKTTVSIALQSAERIKFAADRADALSSIAKAQAASGDVSGALKTADDIDFASVRAKALAAISEAQAASGDISGALKMADDIDFAPVRAKALAAISGSQAASGDVYGALKMADDIDFPFDRAKALAAISESQAASGDASGAKATVSIAFQTAEDITDDYQRVLALVAIVEALAKKK